MHPYILQSLAAERTRDMRAQAKATERARLTRRSRPAAPVQAATRRDGRRLAHHPA
jgi:hypothetical protein